MSNHLGLVACAILAAVALLIPACAAPAPAPRPAEVPATAEVADLTARAHAAAISAAEARAKGDPSADYHARLDAELRALLREAEARQTEQRAELATIVERETAAAREAEIARQHARDRRWAGLAIGGCVAIAVALTLIGLPSWAAIGLPAAAAAGLLWIAAWSSVPWLAWVLGLGLACVLLIGLAGLALWLAREWSRYAADRDRLGHDAADLASLARQPRPLRWLVDRLLGTSP